MKWFLNVHYMIGAHFVLLALSITAGAISAHYARAQTLAILTDRVDEQVEHLATLATITDGNGIDDVAANIIVDCPNRSEFENLLVNLSSLDHKGLLKTQQLFEICGPFYAERKALMVARLDRELEILNEHVDLVATMNEDSEIKSISKDWESLVSLEKERSSLLTEQVGIQRDIITELIAGKRSSDKRVRELVVVASEIGESLGVLDKRIDEMRDSYVAAGI